MSVTAFPHQHYDDPDPNRRAPSQRDPALPTDAELAAEQAVLGGMMLTPAVIAEVMAVLTVEHFYRPAHQVIAAAILRLDEQGHAAEPVAVSVELERQGQLSRVGGLSYLHTLYAVIPTAANASYYAEIVRDCARRRSGNELSLRIGQIVRTGGDGAELGEAIDQALEVYYDQVSGTTHEIQPLATSLDAWLADKEDPTPPAGLSSGLVDLDRITKVRPGELVVIAARPGIGKTVLATQLARQTSIHAGLPALFFSLEMTRAELLDRVFAAEARVDHDHIREKDFQHDDWARIIRHVSDIEAAPLYVEDRSDIGVDEIRAIARDYHRRHGGLSLIVIDYLQLIRPRAQRREVTREREVAEMSRALKVLAKELNVAVVLVAQLNRGSTQRADRTPQESDLRESGSIEADANQVWLLHRPEYGVPWETVEADRDAYRPGEVLIIIAKNRGGRTGSEWFSWRGGYQSIGDLQKTSAPRAA